MPKQYFHGLFFSWSAKLSGGNERGKICWENESRIRNVRYWILYEVIVLKTTSQKIKWHFEKGQWLLITV